MEQREVQNRIDFKNFIIEESFGETAMIDLLAQFYSSQQTKQEYVS